MGKDEMKKMQLIIVDDEPYARKKIKTLIKDEIDIEIVAECKNGREAILEIHKHQPDVVFLDIQMPEIDGFEVLKSIDLPHLPIVVFVTAFDEFALNAFEAHALDYLLKPFDAERLQKTLERVRNQFLLMENDKTWAGIETLLRDIPRREKYVDRFMIRAAGEIYFIKVSDIDWIEAAGNYVEIHIGRKTHLLRETMNNIEKRLDPDKFVRIHRSHIVHLEKIKKLQSDMHGDHIVHLHNGTMLTLTRTYRDNLLGKF